MSIASPLPVVKISRHGADRLRAGHVWVYKSDLRLQAPLPPAALVIVLDERGKPLGSALSSNASEIALRLVRRQPLADDGALRELLRRRVQQAVNYRRRVVENSQAYRLVFSEADGIPGFIADRYGPILSIQPLTQATDREDIKNALIESLLAELSGDAVTSIYQRAEPRIRELEKMPPSSGGLLRGDQSSCVYSMNGINFNYHAAAGQKTGAFLDQRENYAALERYAHGRALDVFCYQGGFALHLARACSSITALDSSRPALEAAEENEKLNPGRPQIQWIEGNAFDFLKDYAARGEQYDTIVLDPPAFAKSKRQTDSAMRAYKELNLRALKMLSPGGILATCSCSYHLSDAEFLAVLTAAAADSHRILRLLEQRTQAADHPIVLNIPETKYLKCLVLQAQ